VIGFEAWLRIFIRKLEEANKLSVYCNRKLNISAHKSKVMGTSLLTDA